MLVIPVTTDVPTIIVGFPETPSPLFTVILLLFVVIFLDTNPDPVLDIIPFEDIPYNSLASIIPVPSICSFPELSINTPFDVPETVALNGFMLDPVPLTISSM